MILISHNGSIVLKYDANTLGQLLSTAKLIEFNTNLLKKPFAAILEEIINRLKYAANKKIKNEYVDRNAVVISVTDPELLQGLDEALGNFSVSKVLIQLQPEIGLCVTFKS